ncbi:MAG: nucleotide exchange factor GrpE, partial [Ignavibacteriales bacterium]|nr:nucleotide exchange factor GrpE [Ignavibacteriales bacterium]
MEEKELKQPEDKEPHISSEQSANDSQKNDLAAKLAEAEKQLENYKDMLLRKAAEFDNYKKRIENESATILKFAKLDVITEILPVADDFERS